VNCRGLKNITYIVVADTHSARIFSKVNKQNSLELVHHLAADLDSKEHKKPSTTYSDGGSLKHAVDPHTDPKEVEQQHFAHEVIAFVDGALKQNAFEGLILIASPKMLGVLSNDLSDQLSKRVVNKIDKNLTEMKISELEEYLKDHC
jgi:protein required for attachment to host cells